MKVVGGATFDTMEGWLKSTSRATAGDISTPACVALDQPGIGNKLAFGVDFDQTELPEILRGLDAICETFPVVGKP